ncbi:peptide deformylase [Clostridium sp. 'deep sea']|uniref:peptide deformylase n=1 Tax=Clostridium sp. 'deep sea' TaxID=2779445 RepID=UPI001896A15D|nr:peptide deformylase [Clostridium sp. 'deep sea']QOR34742.1 peptide deformylase [Clostridium sp. 'deep sea']
MAIKSLALLGNNILRKKCKIVDFPLNNANEQLLIDLNDTLINFKKNNGFGRGIAAPQINVLKKIICINTDTPQYFINPEIIEYSKNSFYMFDDCFSMPEIMVYIERSESIKVKFYDKTGRLIIKQYSGAMSELLQHEIDHLNGIMAIDRVKAIKDIYSKEEWKNKLKG